MVDHAAIVKKVYAALGAKDLKAATRWLAADVVFVTPAGMMHVGGRHEGREAAAMNVWGRIGRDWDPISPDVDTMGEMAPDTIVSFGYYRGRNRASGKTLEAPFAHKWKFRGDEVISIQVYTDSALWNEAWSA